jgi:N-sulfoglucosamine sulfohydrolase
VLDPSERPHIVSITCHDLGQHLGCYGVQTVHTPNLDALAIDGVRFKNSFCVAPQCSPSRAALATGRYPHANSVMGLSHGGFGWELHPNERHVATLLSKHGYETHLFGLQHVTQHVKRLGFDRVHGEGVGRDVADQVVNFVHDLPSQRKPFYAEVNFFEPHRPYDRGGVKPDSSAGIFVPPYLPGGEAAREEMSSLQGAIRAIDTAVGSILNALDDSGLSDKTLTVFTADHGIAMPRAKCTLYDPGIEVALIMRWSDGGIGEGRVAPDLVSNVDVLPTLLEIAGVLVPEGVQGHSFLPLLWREPQEVRDAIFAEKTFHSYYDPMRCVRTERFKYIRNFEPSFLVEVPGDVQQGAIFRTHAERYSTDRSSLVELYDLQADPLERNNLATEAAFGEVNRVLEKHLWRWMEDTDDPLLHGPVASPAYRRALKRRSLPDTD